MTMQRGVFLRRYTEILPLQTRISRLLSFQMRSCISIRGYVRPSIRPSVTHKLKPCKSAVFYQNYASYAVYMALFCGKFDHLSFSLCLFGFYIMIYSLSFVLSDIFFLAFHHLSFWLCYFFKFLLLVTSNTLTPLVMGILVWYRMKTEQIFVVCITSFCIVYELLVNSMKLIGHVCIVQYEKKEMTP